MVRQLQAQPLMALTTMPAGVHIGTQALAFAGTRRLESAPLSVVSKDKGTGYRAGPLNCLLSLS